MKRLTYIIGIIVLACLVASTAFSAYFHEGEKDAPQFLLAYPDKAGTKLDQCTLCHSGGTVGKTKMGSCTWCHYITNYGKDRSKNSLTTNQFGKDYLANGRNAAAFGKISNIDSDGDTYLNNVEISAITYPGDPLDYPGLKQPPQKVYSKQMLESLTQHTQFFLMNANRTTDYYAEYSGVPLRVLLNDAGIALQDKVLPNGTVVKKATSVTVFSPDGFSVTYSLYYDPASPSLYPIYDKDFQYPTGIYYYDSQADTLLDNIIGWCDYSAPSGIGRSNGEPIYVSGGLKPLLAIRRDGSDLDIGHITSENKLDGEGPYRLVVPQKRICPPDQSEKSSYQNVIWPWSNQNDHNSGYTTRSATIIKVEPKPEGCTDIDQYEAGWQYVDEKKIVIYGAIDPDNPNPQDPEEQTNVVTHVSGSTCFISASQK